MEEYLRSLEVQFSRKEFLSDPQMAKYIKEKEEFLSYHVTPITYSIGSDGRVEILSNPKLSEQLKRIDAKIASYANKNYHSLFSFLETVLVLSIGTFDYMDWLSKNEMIGVNYQMGHDSNSIRSSKYTSVSKTPLFLEHVELEYLSELADSILNGNNY